MDERNFRADAAGDRMSGGSRMGRLFSRESRPTPTKQTQDTSAQQYMSGFGGSSGVVINSPTTYEDVQLLIDHLKMQEQVIVDFSTVNQTSVYRILDFMSGAIYALGGSIQQITKNIFLFAPKGVSITVPPQLRR
ncbi:MAG: cell division protein SepF [Bacteroides sp.]|nr:cell division protein SepF [Bacillota bacterium]MCM1393452.1 cell division protein SepF [[Eubacterium] siraeum]MCM1455048.1 cell division protein SepF [Bacteroides sp.]